MTRAWQAMMGIFRSAAVVAIMLGFGTAGCQCLQRESSQQALSERATVLAADNARRIATGDLDGDRQPELVMVDAQVFQVADLIVVCKNGSKVVRL